MSWGRTRAPGTGSVRLATYRCDFGCFPAPLELDRWRSNLSLIRHHLHLVRRVRVDASRLHFSSMLNGGSWGSARNTRKSFSSIPGCGAGQGLEAPEGWHLWRLVLSVGMRLVLFSAHTTWVPSVLLLLVTGRRFGVATNKLGGPVGAGHGAHCDSAVAAVVADRELLACPNTHLMRPPGGNAKHFRLSSHNTPPRASSLFRSSTMTCSSHEPGGGMRGTA